MVRSRDMGNRSYDKECGIWMGRIGNYNLQPGRDSIRQNIHTVVARQQFGQRIRWITYLPLTLRFLSFLISTPYILEEEWAVVSLGDLHGLRFFFFNSYLISRLLGSSIASMFGSRERGRKRKFWIFVVSQKSGSTKLDLLVLVCDDLRF